MTFTPGRPSPLLSVTVPCTGISASGAASLRVAGGPAGLASARGAVGAPSAVPIEAHQASGKIEWLSAPRTSRLRNVFFMGGKKK